MLEFIFFSCILIVVTRVFLKLTIFSYWKNRCVPFANPSVLFGNVWEVISLQKSWAAFIHHMHRKYKDDRYIGIFTVFRPALLIRDLDIINDILIKDFDYFGDNWYEAEHDVDPIMSRSPFVQKGLKWKNSRRLLSSQFTPAKVKTMFPLMQQVCTDMLQYIKDETNSLKSVCIEVADLSARFTGDVVMKCGYGLEMKSFEKSLPETFIIARASLDSASKLSTLKRALGLLFSFFARLFKVTFYGFAVKLFPEIIESAIEDRIKTNVIRNDLLNYLLELRDHQKIDHSDIPGLAFVMFLDGFETSYTVLAVALLKLSLNQEVQNIARNEINDILEKHDGQMTFDALKEMEYIERVVLETVRMTSPIKVMSKVCTKTYKCEEMNNLVIEKGTPVFWSIAGIHEDPKFFPEPDKFDPNRFTEESKHSRAKYSFQGFGEGPRLCIGRRFAITQIMLCLVSILLKYELHLNKKTTLPIKMNNLHIAVIPANGVYINFISRTEV